ncbi:hypothetical protein HU200_050597 [Digitaria exilis]|uniref:DUF2921 domain-containing protein n=1 Tax=Digitaria exilis TaxID=1010633 RepID=A0A835E8X7_9POAL|nr:hypothetical protein HU200_050597 [Digitaria exilis]
MAATVKIVTSLLLNLALFLPCLSAAVSSNQSSSHPSMSKGPIRDDHTRFAADVERHCQSVLSSAAELRYDPDEAGILKFKLSFMNGDWSQDAGQAPLLPSHGSYADAAAARPEFPEAVPLASFMLTNMDMAPWRGARTAFGVSGILSLTITRNWPGIARLLVVFRGVYTETPQLTASGDHSGAGEKVLCMVGGAFLPVPCSTGEDPPVKTHHGEESNFKPPVVADDNILLVLRYPKTLTLTTRAVRGEMTSTRAKSDDAYFDTVRLISQVAAGQVSDYQFQPDEAEHDVVTGCSDHDGGDLEQQHLSSGAALCQIINQYAPYNYKQVMEVIPNLDCKGTDAFCSRVGPFKTSTGAMEDMAFTRSLIVMQGLKCQATTGTDGTPAARVAAMFRYVSPWVDQSMAANRTGLSGMTLSAEGVWTASTGRVCMVACLGVGDGEEEETCHHRVTLFVRTAFTATRRADIVGKITAVDGSHAPLLFQRRVNPRFESFDEIETPRMLYVYTKVKQARELLRRGERNGFRDGVVGRSLLGYPNIAGDEEHDLVSLSDLADNLSHRFQRVVTKLPFVLEWIEEQSFELQILSVGTLVGRYPPQSQGGSSSSWIELLRRVRVHAVENQQILNVSAEFTASRDFFSPILVMSLEGVYNPEDGRMYFIGCRKVYAPWRDLSKRSDLEDGMDCSVEVTVEYPPTTTRWLLMSQTAKVSVASTREQDDPLHFNTTELDTMPIVYRSLRWDELIKPIAEGLLCIITVLLAARTILVP